MDDMLFQNNAKNNIYVLNTSYNKSYDFDSLSRFGSSNRCNEFHSDSQDSTSSTSLCSLTQSCYSTTAAIQKLFNYSTEHFTNNCSSNRTSSSRRSNNNQCCKGCKNSSSSTITTTTNNEQCSGGGSLSQSFSGGGGIASRTTSSNVNSTICAKKKKFLKYLEEEKLRKLSIENLPTTNCERSSSSRSSSKTNGVQNKSNSSKSSSELYQEAVEILGLTCTLCDNCRCLDCQSRYFECDDSDFFMDDCYEYIEQDDDMEECSFYKYPIQQNGSSSGSGSGSGNSSITTTIVHPETCPQENLLHGNCMEMCDKEIQYDESLFAAVTELNSDGEEELN